MYIWKTKTQYSYLFICIVCSAQLFWCWLRSTSQDFNLSPSFEESNITDWNSIFRNLTKHLDCHGTNEKSLPLEFHDFLSVDQVIQRTKNCSQYFSVLQPTWYLSPLYNSKEASNPYSTMYQQKFSIAFAHLVHDQPGIFELFMLLYFRPYNSHCLHIDAKAEPSDKLAFESLIHCYKERFPHAKLFIEKPSLPVYWGHISVLDIDINCARQALENEHRNFDVYINVAGTELPSLPYDEFERLMQEFGVNNVVVSKPLIKRFQHRMKYAHYLSDQSEQVLMNMTRKKTLPPHSIKLFKGDKNVILNRSTVEFMLNDRVSVDFYTWLRDTLVPEEHFYSSLIHLVSGNQNYTGIYAEQTMSNTQSGICPRNTLGKGYHKCHGFTRNMICVLGVGDLQVAREGNCLVINKFSAAQESTVAAALCHFFHVIKLWGKECGHPLLRPFLD